MWYLVNTTQGVSSMESTTPVPTEEVLRDVGAVDTNNDEIYIDRVSTAVHLLNQIINTSTWSGVDIDVIKTLRDHLNLMTNATHVQSKAQSLSIKAPIEVFENQESIVLEPGLSDAFRGYKLVTATSDKPSVIGTEPSNVNTSLDAAKKGNPTDAQSLATFRFIVVPAAQHIARMVALYALAKKVTGEFPEDYTWGTFKESLRTDVLILPLLPASDGRLQGEDARGWDKDGTEESHKLGLAIDLSYAEVLTDDYVDFAPDATTDILKFPQVKQYLNSVKYFGRLKIKCFEKHVHIQVIK